MGKVTRRTIGTGLAGAALCNLGAPSGVAAIGSGAATSTLDLDSPEGRFSIFARMAASLSDEHVYWWRSMVRYGIVDQDVKPLHRTLGGLLMQTKNNGDGTVTYVSREVGYHLDVDTGAFLDSWTNPITGGDVDVNHLRAGPNAVKLTPQGAIPQAEGSAMELPFGVVQSIGPVLVSSDTVWLNFDLHAVGKNGGPSPVLFRDMITYRAARSDLENEALDNVPASYTIQDYLNWRPWMGMGDIRGVLAGRGAGEKVKSPGEFPPELLGLIEENDPAWLSDPDSWQGDSML